MTPTTPAQEEFRKLQRDHDQVTWDWQLEWLKAHDKALIESLTDKAWEYCVEATRKESWSKKELEQTLREDITTKI